MEQKAEINQIILYTTALCNLKCDYCYICKNHSLSEVDAEMEKSFADPNYYYGLFTKYVGEENTNKLKAITLFGGEPLLKLPRCCPSLAKFIDECPNLSEFYIPTNLNAPTTEESIKAFMQLLSNYPDRNFMLDLQISLDGPKEITDKHRGEGVTDTLLNNLYYLLANKFFSPSNVTIRIHPKATINHEEIKNFLDINYVINYYKFFDEQFMDPIVKASIDNIHACGFVVPTIATPWEATKEDGLMITELMKVLNKVEEEDVNKHLFKYKTFSLNWFYTHNVYMHKKLNWTLNNVFCPFGLSIIGLLPENKYCTCTQIFPAYCETYVQDFKAGFINSSRMIDSGVDKDLIADSIEQLVLYKKRINQFNNLEPKKSALVSYCVNLVQQLAKLNQVDPKYQDAGLAEDAVQTVFCFYEICACQNIIDSGNEMLIPVSAFKRFLNGAVDLFDVSLNLIGDEEQYEVHRRE